MHPLGTLITAAADGGFPPVDGGWQRVTPWRPPLEAVVAFTGHAVFAVSSDISDDLLTDLGADGFGGAHDPRLVAALAGPDAWIDSLDVLLAARGTARSSRLVPRQDLDEHPRTQFAAAVRGNLEILGYPGTDESDVAILSTGVAGLRELSFEVAPERRGGSGTALIEDALDAAAPGELVLTAIAPGNAASLRAALRAGFTPLGSVQLFRRRAARRDH
jgi:GNAT superfamily N-acetyltransferase